MRRESPVVIYWDTSAIIATLFHDHHSNDARGWLTMEGYHLLSSLAWAEVMAIISRIRRERKVSDEFLDAAVEVVKRGPWLHLNQLPDRMLIRSLAKKWPLRGADLWHIGLALTLKKDRPELMLLTFDERMKSACRGEGVS
jgi:predicted nucleic acid-binding protein